MSEVYNTYEQEFHKLLTQFQNQLLYLNQLSEKQQQLQECKNTLQDLNNCYAQLEIECSSIAVSDRQALKIKTKNYKQDIEGLRKQLYTVEESIVAQNVLGNGESHQEQINEEKLVIQSVKLLDAKRVGFEIETIANNTQQQLSQNTEKLQRSIQRTRDTQVELGESNSRLKTIRNRMKENKLVCYVVLFIFIVAAAIIGYYNVQ